jgi:hypothetical protein
LRNRWAEPWWRRVMGERIICPACGCETDEDDLDYPEVLAEMGGKSILWCDTHEERIPAPGHACRGWSPFAKCHEVAAWLVVPEGGE